MLGMLGYSISSMLATLRWASLESLSRTCKLNLSTDSESSNADMIKKSTLRTETLQTEEDEYKAILSERNGSISHLAMSVVNQHTETANIKNFAASNNNNALRMNSEDSIFRVIVVARPDESHSIKNAQPHPEGSWVTFEIGKPELGTIDIHELDNMPKIEMVQQFACRLRENAGF